MSPERLHAAIAEVRALTDRPFAINLAAASPARIDPARIARACELLAPYRAELGLPPEPPEPPEPPDFDEPVSYTHLSDPARSIR